MNSPSFVQRPNTSILFSPSYSAQFFHQAMNYHPGFHKVQQKHKLLQSEYCRVRKRLDQLDVLLRNVCFNVSQPYHFKLYDNFREMATTLPEKFLPVDEKIITLQELYDDIDSLYKYIMHDELRREDNWKDQCGI